MNETNKVVEKIKKLLALSRSDNVHEASSAAERASRLMLEHRLSEADVVDPIIEEKRIVDERLMSTWRWGLLTACARSYYCECVRIEEDTTFNVLRVTGIVFGVATDIEAVICLYEHLAVQIDELAELSRPLGRLPSLYTIERELRWKEGAVRAITEKMEKGRIMFERESAEAERRAYKAWEAVRAYRERKYPQRYQPEMVAPGDARVFEEGFNAADKALNVPDRARGRLQDS